MTTKDPAKVVSEIGLNPNQEVIERLKEALAEAEAGDIQGFAMASINKGQSVVTSYVRGSVTAVAIAGAISVLDKDFYVDIFTKH
jgi:hypothetical protein